jgi:hypothetical protein
MADTFRHLLAGNGVSTSPKVPDVDRMRRSITHPVPKLLLYPCPSVDHLIRVHPWQKSFFCTDVR